MEVAGVNYAKDMMTESTKIGVGYLWTQVGYVLHYKKKVDDLKDAVSKLVDHKIDIEKSIESSHGDDKEVTRRTVNWLSEVAKLEESVKKIVVDCEKKIEISKMAKRFQLGKNSEKLMADAYKLDKERNALTTFYPSVVPRFSSRPLLYFKEYTSMRGVLDKVINGLKDDNNHVLAIYGMGGIGKSTLVDQIGRQMEVDKVFDVVVSINLSRNPGLAELQDCIAEQLGKSFKANSVEQKSGELARALKREKSVLIILDNIWSEVDLRKTGVPFGDDHKGCKILISTRKIEVCNQMDADAQFLVNFLSEEESWDLFKSKAGEVVKLTEVEPIAKEVARECGNLPLAIVVVGTALRGANERDTWSHALRQLRHSNPKDLVNVEEKLFKCLELSYEHLGRDNWKLLFLFCSLFPEGYELSEDELMRFAIGENMLGRFSTLEEARENMHMLVSKLISSCLLLRTRKAKIAKMHDVVRDVAVYIASRQENGFYIQSTFSANEFLKEEDFNRSKRISLINTSISQLPSNPLALELSVLLARNNPHLTNLPDNFFRQMAMLTVLDLSDSNIMMLSSSVQHLRRLKVLCLNRCKGLRSISIIGKLETLQVLSLQGCPMKSLPKEIGKLIKLKLLDLSCSPNLIIPPNILSNLRYLEELYLDSSYLSKNVLTEITFLKRLDRLQLYINDTSFFSQEVVGANSLENLKSFVLYSEISWVKMAKRYKKNLYIKGIENVAAWVKVLLRGTEDVSFDSCFSNVTPLIVFAGFEAITGFCNLKILRVSKCHRIVYLLSPAGSTPKDTFVNLEELYLTNLDNLNGISEGALSELSFRNTRKIHISGCKSMLSLMPYSLLVRLHHSLEELTVKNCGELQGMFYFPSYEISSVTFSSLKLLYLCDLPKLNGIWSGTVPQGSFANLKDLHVQGCDGLRRLVPASVVSGFQYLERLLVSNNSAMEEIISDDGFELDQDAFPRLIELSLEDLPKLNNFYKRGQLSRLFSWPLLKKLKIGGCQDMEMLPIGQDSAPDLDKIELLDQDDLVWYNRLPWNDTRTSSRFKLL